MRQGLAAGLTALALLGATPAFAAEGALFAEFRELCIETSGDPAAVAAASGRRGWVDAPAEDVEAGRRGFYKVDGSRTYGYLTIGFDTQRVMGAEQPAISCLLTVNRPPGSVMNDISAFVGETPVDGDKSIQMWGYLRSAAGPRAYSKLPAAERDAAANSPDLVMLFARDEQEITNLGYVILRR